MIVWLASYPRSGNTLLRTVLHQTLGCESFNDEIDPAVRRNVALAEGVERDFGHVELPEAWDTFYPRARDDTRTYFVKTHRAPPDRQRAIYVVRDGRQVLVSYARFHRKFHGENAKSLLQLAVGDDYYGSWSGHYRQWTRRDDGGSTLVVKYEELADASDALVEEIARFVGHAGPRRPWRNPFDEFNRKNPDFFAQGKRHWQGDSEWSALVDAVFFRLHGELMDELGYATPAQMLEATRRLGPNEVTLVDLACSMVRDKQYFEQVCRERQVVIDNLQKACEERLALIERLATR